MRLNGLHGIKPRDFKTVLQNYGYLDQQDANKVAFMLQTEEHQGPIILIDNLVGVLNRIKRELREKNTRIQILQRAIANNPSLLRNLESKDIDMDGAVNIDGFKATFLV